MYKFKYILGLDPGAVTYLITGEVSLESTNSSLRYCVLILQTWQICNIEKKACKVYKTSFFLHFDEDLDKNRLSICEKHCFNKLKCLSDQNDPEAYVTLSFSSALSLC